MDERLKRQMARYHADMRAVGRLPPAFRFKARQRVEEKWSRTRVGDYLRAREAGEQRRDLQAQRDEALARAQRAEAELAALKRGQP